MKRKFPKRKRFSAYIRWLKKNGFDYEANYYDTEVVKVLCEFLKKTRRQVLHMPVSDIMPSLANIARVAGQEWVKQENKKWDVEVTNERI